MENLPIPRRRGRPRKLTPPIDGEITQVPYDLIDDVPCREVVTSGADVQRVGFHAGVHIAYKPVLSIDADKDHCTLTLCDHGLHIELQDHSQYVVGMPNIVWIKLK